MKIKVLLLAMTIAAAFTACNDNDEPKLVEPEEVELSFTTEIQGGTTIENLKVAGGTYDRNNAPAYLSGIKITADHVDFDPITEEFPFEDNEGDVDNPITMSVKVGENDFTAVSTTNVNSFYKIYLHEWDVTVPDITGLIYPVDITQQTYEARALLYSAELLTLKPIYADYETASALNKDIYIDNGSNTVDNSLALTLTPTTGRSTLVFEQSEETKAIGFRLNIGLYDDNGSPTYYDDDFLISVDYDALDNGVDDPVDADNPADVFIDGAYHSQYNDATAFVFNLKEMMAGTYIKAAIEKYTKGANQASDYTHIGDVIVETQTGKNITHFIYLNSESFETASISATISGFTESGGGEAVN